MQLSTNAQILFSLDIFLDTIMSIGHGEYLFSLHGNLSQCSVSQNCFAFPLKKVKTVKPGSAAEAAGLQPSDFILRINGQTVFHQEPKDVERLINNSGFSLLLDIER